MIPRRKSKDIAIKPIMKSKTNIFEFFKKITEYWKTVTVIVSNGVATSAFSNTQTITGTKLIANGGYPGSTDWVDSNSDGVADDFSVGGTGSGSIITGNGFSGRAQRLDGTSNTAVLLHSSLVLTSGKTYYFEIKHRSDVEVRMYTYNLNEVVKILALNTSLIPTSTKLYYTIVTGSNFRFRLMAAGYAEIDEFQVREITIS